MNSSIPTIFEPSTIDNESTLALDPAGANTLHESDAHHARPNGGDDQPPSIDANPVATPNPTDANAPPQAPEGSELPVSNVVPIGSATTSRKGAKKRGPASGPPEVEVGAPNVAELAHARMLALRSEPAVREPGTSAAASASATTAVAGAVANRHAPRGDVGVHISVRQMRSGDGGEILVDPDDVAAALDELGRDAVAAGLRDVQVAFAWKPREGLSDVHSGFVLDIDAQVPDVEVAVRDSGVHPPTLWWRSPRGVKLVWLFETAVGRSHFDVIAQTMTVAFEGADLSSLRPTQHQRLAHVDREGDDGSVRTLREPVLAFGQRLDAETFVPTLPKRLASLLLAEDSPARVDLDPIVAHLAALNIALPESGSVLQRRCPLGEHSAKKCHVHAPDHDGHVIYCHGDHDGAGPQKWKLSRLAQEAAAAGFGMARPEGPRTKASTRVPALRDVPLTWVATDYVRFHLTSAMSGRLLVEAERVALRALLAEHVGCAKAFAQAPGSVRADLVPALERALVELRRQHAEFTDKNGVPAIMPAWDVSAQRLVSVTKTYAFQSGLERCSKKEIDNLVLRALRTTARVWVEDEKDGSSTVHACLVGVRDAKENLLRIAWPVELAVRRAFGVPEVRFEAYPIAFCESGFEFTSERPMKYTRVPDAHGQCIEDPVAFIVGLFRSRATPFATENDARLFAAVLAAPLFRELMQGRIPCAVLTGSSGAGKNLIAECITAAWGGAGSPSAPAECYLTAESANATEFRLTVANMGAKIILRLPEVAKTGVAQEVIIKSERRTLFGRAHYGDPLEVPHRFLFIGDTLEGLPKKFEYERRIIAIRLLRNEQMTPDSLIHVFREHGPAMIEGFRRIAEAHGRDFFRARKSADGRSPLAHALAEMCGAVLTEVRGAELSEFWDAMFDLIHGQTVTERGVSELVQLASGNPRKKDGFLPGMFGSYSLDELCEKAKKLPEHTETFRRINPNTIRHQLAAEKAPHFEEVVLGRAKAKLLFVLARDTWHVFGLARNDKRFFFVEPVTVIAHLRSCGEDTSAFEAAWARAKLRDVNPIEELAEQVVAQAERRAAFVESLEGVRSESAPDESMFERLEQLAVDAGVLPVDASKREPGERAALLKDVIDHFKPSTCDRWRTEEAS